MASHLYRQARRRISVTGVDFNAAMLREAKRRHGIEGIAFHRADATALHLSDDSFDAVTISFALRNLNISPERLYASLGECLRVLRPGGRLITVETTQPRNGLIRRGVRLYVRTVVPRIGARMSGSAAAYAYLANTIPRFHGAPELATILRDIGFGPVNYTYLTFGLVAIHEAVKPDGEKIC